VKAQSQAQRDAAPSRRPALDRRDMDKIADIVTTATGGKYHHPDCVQIRGKVALPVTSLDVVRNGEPTRLRPCGTCQGQPVTTPASLTKARRGVQVPAAECLPPHLRVSVRDFVALMEAMMERHRGDRAMTEPNASCPSPPFRLS
jgi:hypothetical protein